MDDTPPDIEKRMAAMMAARTPTERLRMASSMFDAGRELMKAGLLHELGPLNEAQLRAQMFMRMYSDCFTQSEIDRIMSTIPNMQLDTRRDVQRPECQHLLP
jgi:hypothetical protein